MCQLIESIEIREGAPQYLTFHQQRVERSSLELYQKAPSVDLFSIKHPPFSAAQLYKWRIVYDDSGVCESEYTIYHPKMISSAKIVEDNEINYPFKFKNRERIEYLFSQRDVCDDVIILKDGYVTDGSFCNLAFYSEGIWYTPDTPLLPGTCRARLIELGVMQERAISVEDISAFDSVCFINAFRPLSLRDSIPVSAIVF